MSSLAVLAILGVAWWLSLRALAWMESNATAGPLSAREISAILRHWPGPSPSVGVRVALEKRNLIALQDIYCELKAEPASFAASLVSLVLAEAGADLAKAHRGLEAIRLMRNRPALEADASEQSAALDYIEGRLRLVLADAGQDLRQQRLAIEAFDRFQTNGERRRLMNGYAPFAGYKGCR
jgi:hypothetical protein